MHSSPLEAGAAALVRRFLVRSRFGIVRALALSLALLAPLPGHAQCDARLQCCATAPPGGDPEAGACSGDDPAQLPGSAPGVGAGNPLDIVSGNKYQRETDMPRLPGVLGLEVVRHYNSGASHRDTGGLGRGWRLSYEVELHVGARSLTLIQADGRTLRFVRGVAEPDTYTSADPNAGRVQRFMFQHRRGTYYYVWTWPSGRQLRFHAGVLEHIQEPSGERLHLTHLDGRLVLVRDPQGRALHFVRDRHMRLNAIETPVGRIDYTRDSRAARLLKVTAPGGTTGRITRSYHYEDERHPHALTGISVSGTAADGTTTSQRLATWGYDDRGLAISSVKGDGRDHIERVTVRRRATDTGGEATLTNSLGHDTIYRWRAIAGRARLTEAIGPGCSTCAPTNRRWRYDARGRLTDEVRLDDHGRPAETTTYRLDVLGRVVQVGRIAHHAGRAQPVQWLVRYGYASPDHRSPALIERPSIVPGREHLVSIQRNRVGQTTRVTEEGFSPLDAKLKPVMQGAPLRRITTYGYSDIAQRSLLTSIDGPLPNGPTGTPADSDITLLRYDDDGNRVMAVTHPGGLQTSYAHDAAGRIVGQTPPDGVPQSYVLDPWGIALWRHGAVQVSVQRDAAGRPVRIQRNDGANYTIDYDAAGRARSVTDAQGSRREVQHDTEGRLLQSLWRDATGHVPFEPLELRHDAAGRVISAPHGLHVSHDAQGRPSVVRDALDRRVEYRYDAAGRLTEHTLHVPHETPRLLKTAHVPQASSVTTRLLYRQSDDPVGLIDGNGAQTVTDLDDFGRTVRLTSPDTGQTRARYDEADRPVEVLDGAGNRTVLVRDPAGRVTRRHTSHPQRPGEVDEARWRYEGTRLVEAANAHQVETYRWDDQGRLTGRTTRLGDGASLVFETRYRHDELGRLVETRRPDGLVVIHHHGPHGTPTGQAVRYPNGKVQRIVVGTADAVQGLRELAFGNGIVTSYARDRQARLAGLVTAAPGASPLYSQRIAYDPGGRITGIERSGATESYAYDGHDRLVEVRTPREHRRYAYDAVGNRTAAWHGALPAASGGTGATAVAESPLTPSLQQLTYQPQSNRLQGIVGDERSTVAANPAAFGYDAAGNPTSIGPRTYRYGVGGRLHEVAEQGTVLGRYVYNASGERVGKHAGGRNTHYLYDGHKVVAQADDNGAITAHYFYVGHAPVAMVEPARAHRAGPGWSSVQASLWQRALRWVLSLAGQEVERSEVASVRLLFLHTDHLGTPRLATDANQRVVWSAAYEAFGRAVVAEDPDGDGEAVRIDLRLPGQIFDAETGTHYNYFRDYDPGVGRYLQSDPIGLAGGVNAYAYGEGNPMSYLDPIGLDAIFVHYIGYSVAVTKNISAPLGHAGAIAVDPETGKTQYYEFGRYGGKCGDVRGPFDVGKIWFDKNGNPTQESIAVVLKKASEEFGKDSPTYHEYSKKPFKDVIDYAEQRRQKAETCERPYNVIVDNCKNFAREAAGV